MSYKCAQLEYCIFILIMIHLLILGILVTVTIRRNMYKIMSECKYVKCSHENVHDNVHIVIIYVHIHIR